MCYTLLKGAILRLVCVINVPDIDFNTMKFKKKLININVIPNYRYFYINTWDPGIQVLKALIVYIQIHTRLLQQNKSIKHLIIFDLKI